MALNKPNHENATTYALSGQDFGDPKLKKGEIPAVKETRFREHSNCIICKSCGKRNYIPMNPIEKTTDLVCKCGNKVAVLAGRDYGDTLRKANHIKAMKAALDELESQII